MAARPPTSPPSGDKTDESSQNEEHRSGAILFLLGSVVFMAVVNGTMVNVALPYIGEDFAVSEGVYGWIVTGYVLSFGIFNAIDGRLADLVGIRRLYLSGVAVLGLTAQRFR